MTLAFLAAVVLGQVIIGPPPTVNAWRRPRIPPRASMPANLNAFADAGVTPVPAWMGDAGFEGAVSFRGAPVAGGRITAVGPGNQLGAMRGPCASCLGHNSAVCGCGDLATALAAALDRREGELKPLVVTATSSEGRFEVKGLRLGFGLWIDAPGAAPRYLEPFTLDGGVQLQEPIYVEGDVVDESRQPISQAIVTWPSRGARYFDAVTDAKGHFKLGPLDEAPSGVIVRRTGYLARWAELHRQPIVLADPHALRVSVRDDEGPVAGATVALSSLICRAGGVTDARGEVVLRDLSPGTFEVIASTDAGLFAKREVDLPVGDFERVIAPMVLRPFVPEPPKPPNPQPRSTKVSITIVGGADATPTYRSVGGVGFGSGSNVPELEDGTYEISAEGDGVIGIPQVIQVPRTKRVTVKLAPEPFVSGRLLDALGAPIARTGVWLECGAFARSEAETDADGRFRLSARGVGTCKVASMVKRPGLWLWASKTIKLAPAQRASVRLDLLPTSPTAGRVIDQRGAPVAGLEVRFNGPDARASSVTGADGSFEVPLPAGLYEVGAAGDRYRDDRDQRITSGTRGTVVKVRGPTRVNGRVVDESGHAVTDFEVNGQRLSSAQGRFEVEAHDSVFAFSPGAGRGMRRVSEQDGDVGDVVLGFDRVVEILVLGPDGQPLRGATLRTSIEELWRCSDESGLITDKHGRGWVEHRPGVRVTVAFPHLPSKTVAWPVPREVRLEAPVASLRGVVKSRRRSASICVMGASGSHQVNVGPDGTWSIDGLRAGTHRVHVTAADAFETDSAVRTIEIVSGEARVDFDLGADLLERRVVRVIPIG